MSVRSAKKVKPGACDEIPEVSVAAVDKVRVLVVVADETPSSELSPLVISFFFDAWLRFFRGLLRAFVGDSNSSVLATSLPERLKMI